MCDNCGCDTCGIYCLKNTKGTFVLCETCCAKLLNDDEGERDE